YYLRFRGKKMHDFRTRFPSRQQVPSEVDQRARGTKRDRAAFLKRHLLHEHAVESVLYQRFSDLCGHEDHTMLLPMDLLHTVHGGIVRYAVIWALDVAQVGGPIFCCACTTVDSSG